MQTPILIGIHGVKQSGKGTVFHFISEWGRALGLSARDRGFADNVKWALARIFHPGISMEDAIKWVDKFKESDAAYFSGPELDGGKRAIITMRQAAQHLGTEVGRDIFGYDFWVDQLLPARASARNPEGWRGSFMLPPRTAEEDPYHIAELCGITDLRFDNELDRINELRHVQYGDHTLGDDFVPARALTIKVRNKNAEQKVIEEAKRQGKELHRSELGLADELFDYVINNNDSKEELGIRVRAMMNEANVLDS